MNDATFYGNATKPSLVFNEGDGDELERMLSTWAAADVAAWLQGSDAPINPMVAAGLQRACEGLDDEQRTEGLEFFYRNIVTIVRNKWKETVNLAIEMQTHQEQRQQSRLPWTRMKAIIEPCEAV